MIGVVGAAQGWIFSNLTGTLQSGDFRVWKRALDPKDKTLTIWRSPIFWRSSMGFEETKCSASQNQGVAGFQKWCHFHFSCEFCGCFPPSIHKWNPPTTRTPSVREIQRAEAQCGGAIGTRNTLLLTLKALVFPLIASLTLAAGSRETRFQALWLPYFPRLILRVAILVRQRAGSDPEKSELQELLPSSSWYSPATR